LELFEQIPQERLEPAVVQIDLAKHFALMGLHSIARALVKTNTAEQNSLEGVTDSEIRALHSSNQNEFSFKTEYLLPIDTAQVGVARVRRAAFTMNCSAGSYFSLIESPDLQKTLQRIVQEAKRSDWRETVENEGLRTILHTPLGFRLELEYLTQ
jgi:hypothetical protein